MDVKISSSSFKCPMICLFFYYLTLVDSYFMGTGNYRNGLHDMNLKRRNPTGLIPFPRVGKRGYTKFSDSETMKRREGLIPFPRVGKSVDRSKGKINDEDEFLLAWIGRKLDQDTNSDDFLRKIFGVQLPEYLQKLQSNEREIRLYGERMNPSKSIDELVLPEEVLMSLNNELSSTNGNKKLEQETLNTNLANDGWHRVNLEHLNKILLLIYFVNKMGR